MHSSVQTVWVDFNKDLEGIVSKPYADVKNLITVGMGNLIDPVAVALAVEGWVRDADGADATHADISDSFYAVKDDPLSAKMGWRYAAALKGNTVHLTQDGINTLIFKKLASNDAMMQARFPDWESRPADAQLGVHSMAWAMGPAFFAKFPKFSAAFAASDYLTCAAECKIMPEGGTVRIRNQRNALCFMHAKQVLDAGSDVTALLWTPP